MNRILKPVLLVSAMTLMAACHMNDNPDEAMSTPDAAFRVTVTNLTAGQPFSPPVLVLHSAGYHAFEEGKGAGIGLEMIAESGRNSDFASDAVARGFTVKADTTTPILPGQSRSYELRTSKMTERLLSMAAMLGKTNDGFSGVDNLPLDSMHAGEKRTLDLPGWDAGTEANRETPATVGALGGEGFNPMRDDSPGVVTIHPGVRSNLEDPSSGLGEQQRFDNPVLRLTIERL